MSISPVRPSTRLIQFVFTAIFLLAAGTAHAQGGGGTDFVGTGGRHTIQGRIYFPSGRSADLRAKVKLETTTSGTLFVLADPDGVFKFTNLSSGSYTIVIDAGEQYEIAREPVYIEGNSSLGRGMRMTTPPRNVIVPIYLQVKRALANSARTGVINAALANVPNAAVEQYQRALESLRAGNAEKAMDQLRGAISLYPDFALALNELGVQYLKAGAADKAVETLQRAVRVAPENLSVRLNYGIALLEKKRFADAAAELRHALKINDNAATGHLYLGITLINMQNYADAEIELQRAASMSGELSLAHYYLGGLYWRDKQYQRAADELEKYLQLAANAPDAERIRATIKDLRAKESRHAK